MLGAASEPLVDTWGREAAVARDRPEDRWETNSRDVVVLNTTGELFWLLGAADLAIVGMDRNVFEPASQGIPTLYFDGPWANKRTELDLLVANGAAHAVEAHRLAHQITEALGGRLEPGGTEEARRALEDDILPPAGLLASLAISHLVAEDAASRRG